MTRKTVLDAIEYIVKDLEFHGLVLVSGKSTQGRIFEKLACDTFSKSKDNLIYVLPKNRTYARIYFHVSKITKIEVRTTPE